MSGDVFGSTTVELNMSAEFSDHKAHRDHDPQLQGGGPVSDPVTAAVKSNVPSAAQAEVLEVSYLTAAGYGVREIASLLGLPWPRVNALKDQAGTAVIVQMRDDGYADTEIIRTLGVPTARVVGSVPVV